MCGIFACVSDEDVANKIINNESLHELLSRRGPDYFSKVNLNLEINQINDSSSHVCLTLLSSVLQLRGDPVCEQPYESENGQENRNVLQWNGEIFDGSIKVDKNTSDTQVLFDKLSKCDTNEKVLTLMSMIRGPWAFTYWNHKSKRFWFGRDIFGRRSLCWNTNMRDKMLLISSIGAEIDLSGDSIVENELENKIIWEEVPANGIYCIDLSKRISLEENPCQNRWKNMSHFKWDRKISGEFISRIESPFQSEIPCLSSPIKIPLNRTIPTQLDLQADIPQIVIEEFLQILRDAVQKRCSNHQNVCKVCFYCLNNQVNTELDNISTDSEGDITGNTNGSPQSQQFEYQLSGCSHASMAVLFSGGIDSTILALLADESIPKSLPIDLLNVAFDNEAPDRETGLAAWKELRHLRPDRTWNFISIHVSKEELNVIRDKHIKYLVRPSQTVLDDSIGCALWFASQGKGLPLDDGVEAYESAYESQARIVLIGMGADEQLAGYSRHRRVFDKNGWEGLLDEISLEIERLPSRNLGRDDRIVSDHGREPRFPFLDENVVNYLNGLPIWQKCNLNMDRSVGEKLLLRKVACHVGMNGTASHLKRAIQFGSRITKIEDSKVKGNDICNKLIDV